MSQSLLHQVNDFHPFTKPELINRTYGLNPFYIRSMISTLEAQTHSYQPYTYLCLNPFYIRSMISTAAYVTLELTTTCKAISCNLHNL
uniref:Uncharacterized protein n=1 Tax=Kuenenia stuttgartiensis TaxID=174633 RepID=Q1Q3I4_KUEST|nr:unknown protein [Candidatus Kuenenia stuttgartiensis]